MRCLLVAGSAFALVWAVPSAGRADCTETSPAAGVTVADCRGDGLHWAEITADLSASDVGVRVSRPDERAKTPDELAGMVSGAIAIVPGGPFLFPTYDAVGLTVGDGTAWDEGRDDARLSVVAFDARGGAVIPPAEQVVPYEPWMRDAVSGAPVLRDGVPIAPCGGTGCDAMPRTAIGLGDDGRTLVVVVVEGWAAESAGVTDPELGELARAAGADDALRTGEGATSVLWAGGAIAVQSSDGAPRAGGAYLALLDRGMGETARIKGIVKSNEAGMPVLPDAHIRIETIDRTFVAEGPTMTTGAYFEYALPVRDYFVIVSNPGYRTGCKYCPLTQQDMGELWCSAFLSPGSGEETCQAPGFGVDAGPWPIGSLDAGPPDGGARDGGRRTVPVDPGCSAVPGAGGRGQILDVLAFALALAVRRRVRTTS